MALPTPDEHAAAAEKLLDELEVHTHPGGGDAQTRALAAVAHATLAVAEQVRLVRRDLGGGGARPVY